MKDYEVMVGLFAKHEILFMLFWDGRHIYFLYLFLYIVHSSPFLCVCGDDRITCYPGADDLTGGPGDA